MDDDTASEILYDTRNEEICISFPEDFRSQLHRAAKVMNERHLAKSAIFLIELGNTLKRCNEAETTQSLDPYMVEYSIEEESRLTVANFHLGIIFQVSMRNNYLFVLTDILSNKQKAIMIIYNAFRR